MARLLVFGSTGKLGCEIANVAVKQGYEVTAVLRRESQAHLFKELPINIIVVDVSQPWSLLGICNGYEIVISALGKSVSPNENSKSTFTEVDLNMNSLILDEAVKSNIKKFVYISAFHAEKYQHLEYFNVHHQFSERLKSS
jgi:nucleoside-diphosphate-sugar epimerase